MTAIQSYLAYAAKKEGLPDPVQKELEVAGTRLAALIKELEGEVKPGAWAVVLGGTSKILKERYGKNDW